MSRESPAATLAATILVVVRHHHSDMSWWPFWVDRHVEVAFEPIHAVILWCHCAIVVEVAVVSVQKKEKEKGNRVMSTS